MKLLVVAATKMEIEAFIHHFGLEAGTISSSRHQITLLITGVGIAATAYALGKELAVNSYDLAINAGIAGSFDPSITSGQVVLVREDHFADLGAENNDEFLSIDEMGFGESKLIPLRMDLELSGIEEVRGITVNTVHGREESIRAVKERLNPQTESMEGAAFFYACNDAALPSIQLRAISNQVEVRNLANWTISVAVSNLNTKLIDFIESI